MKLSATVFFIFFSLLSTVLELASFDMPCHQASTFSSKVLASDHSDNPHNTSCHDSNCYGSAHFGHGFYYQALPFKLNTNIIPRNFTLRFAEVNLQSLYYLDKIFRPPLHTV